MRNSGVCGGHHVDVARAASQRARHRATLPRAGRKFRALQRNSSALLTMLGLLAATAASDDADSQRHLGRSLFAACGHSPFDKAALLRRERQRGLA